MNENKLILSISRVKTYQQCPRKYYYNYIEKLPKLSWDHFNLGTFVHGVLEFFHENLRDNNSLKDVNINKIMKQSFQKQYFKMKNGNIILKKEMLLEAKDMLMSYMNNIINKGIDARILILENEFKIPLNEKYLIKGIIDRLDQESNGTLHIKDYKTNKNSKYMEPSQLITYGLYILDKYPNIKKYKGSYIMMRFNKCISYEFKIRDIEKEKNKLIKYADSIANEQRWKACHSNLCGWCDFKNVCLNTW